MARRVLENRMDEWNPRRLWAHLRDALRGWMDDEDEEQAKDPSLLFHMSFSAPLFLAVLMAVQLLLQAAR